MTCLEAFQNYNFLKSIIFKTLSEKTYTEIPKPILIGEYVKSKMPLSH